MTVEGDGSFDQCAGLATVLMDKDATCLTDSAPRFGAPGGVTSASRSVTPPPINPKEGGASCSIGGTYQPALGDSPFVAFSAFSYLWGFLKLPFQGTDMDALQDAVQSLCGTSWEEVQKKNPGVPAEYLSQYCATGTFAHSLFTEGYGIAGASTQVSVADPAGAGADYGWTLGSIYFDANAAWRLR